jgi:hypothetical protein
MENNIKLAVSFFMSVCVILFILISVYYILPNNYELYTEANKKAFKKVKEMEIGEEKIEGEKIRGYYIRFSEECNIIVDNDIKSDSINMKRGYYIRVNNGSDIYINNKKEGMKIRLYLLRS